MILTAWAHREILFQPAHPTFLVSPCGLMYTCTRFLYMVAKAVTIYVYVQVLPAHVIWFIFVMLPMNRFLKGLCLKSGHIQMCAWWLRTACAYRHMLSIWWRLWTVARLRTHDCDRCTSWADWMHISKDIHLAKPSLHTLLRSGTSFKLTYLDTNHSEFWRNIVILRPDLYNTTGSIKMKVKCKKKKGMQFQNAIFGS